MMLVLKKAPFCQKGKEKDIRQTVNRPMHQRISIRETTVKAMWRVCLIEIRPRLRISESVI